MLLNQNILVSFFFKHAHEIIEIRCLNIKLMVEIVEKFIVYLFVGKSNAYAVCVSFRCIASSTIAEK
jgi:hypothetical protein